jgi:hypothetical protein
MRYDNIKSKLEHTNSNIQKMADLLFESKMQKQTLENVTHLVGDSLSNTTECFDYCAKDIFEKYILPKYPHMKDWNIYFPFSEDSLNREPFSLLKVENQGLYNYLLNLAQEAKTDNVFKDTLIKASLPKIVRKIVTEKKHNDVIEVNSKGGAELVVDLEGMKAIIPLRQIGVTETEIDHGSMQGPMIIANGYELKDTGDEVLTFCQMSLTATKIITDEIYQGFLNK